MSLITGLYLHKVVEQGQWHNNGQEDGSRVADNHNGGDHCEKCVHPAPQELWQDVVNGLHVTGEAIEDATDGCGVKEGHGRAQDVVQHAFVELCSRPHLADGCDDGVHQYKEGCQDTHRKVGHYMRAALGSRRKCSLIYFETYSQHLQHSQFK